MAKRSSSSIPVTLLTGFLGSGKTTLLNQLVRQPEMSRTLVVINEFGEIGLDHQLFSATDETQVMAMDSGCVCCTIRGDLAQTLRNATWRFAREGKRQFDRVIIETTGLADPAPIMHTLMTDERIATRYRLDGIVSIVDASHGQSTLNHHTEAVKQSAVADLLLITKSDLASPEEVSGLQARLSSINPGARQQRIINGEINARNLMGLGLLDADGLRSNPQRWLATHTATPPAFGAMQFSTAFNQQTSSFPGFAQGHTGSDRNRHDDHIRAHCFTLSTPIQRERFEAWLELMLSLMGDNMLRLKGILNIAGHNRPSVIHGVQHVFHPPMELDAWPDDDHRSRLVFITRDIPRESLESVMVAIT
ncbi:CobW family GTP-binding protein [Kushneria phosphatilytica]|uniref:GTP-binding protein n=1 Tax=Kushneria phosphatilytica TaxID=657387 RepID=A0A1S1NZ21_9GAMM|nr:GTP-binding protein [Kushneria phosphatilytica]OHV13105.1 GTP-binding protein [Kushneria phosphatilytica]QEL10658.1 GTP-binding protein [Kushneria phosphatilytica]